MISYIISIVSDYLISQVANSIDNDRPYLSRQLQWVGLFVATRKLLITSLHAVIHHDKQVIL